MRSEEYERIAAKYCDVVYRVALSYAKSPQDAEDILQNTFLKLLTKNMDFADEEHIRRWLIRVAVNECNSLWTSFWKKKVDFVEQEAEIPIFEKPEYSDLYRALRNLPAKCRIVVHLFYYEEYSTKEIAALLHIPDATVRTRLVRARKLLKQQLKEAWENEQ